MAPLLRISPIVERELRVASRRPATYWSRVGTGALGVTVLLWLGPAALLFGGAGWLAFRLRRRRDEVAAEKTLSATDSARARALLDGASGAAQSESPGSRS